MLYRIYYIMAEENKTDIQAQEGRAPDFSSHIPQLIDQYLNIRSNMGPGALCIAFDSESGDCQCYYVKNQDAPPVKEIYDKVDSECKPGEESPVLLIFHDSDKTFMDGQPQSFKLRMEEKDEKNNDEHEALPP